MKSFRKFIKFADLQMLLAKRLIRLADNVLSYFINPQSVILQRWYGKAPLHSCEEKKLCLFAHFDKKNKIAPYVLNYVKSLHELGSDIVFVSTCKDLHATEIAKILPFCILVVRRKNISLDFGSWRVGLAETMNLSYYDYLILANDSVYGPIFPLQEIFFKMNAQKLGLWGITSTSEKTYHLQSYFLVFDRKTVESEAFSIFWKRFHFYRSKARIIEEYEIGLTTWARKSNWHSGAYIENSRITLHDINPTLFYWDRLIEEYRCPFLKTEVLRLNRAQSDRVNEWRAILESKSTYDTALISENLT